MWLQENVVIKKVELQLEGRDFEKAVTPVIREYFEHGDTNEVVVSITCSVVDTILLIRQIVGHRNNDVDLCDVELKRFGSFGIMPTNLIHSCFVRRRFWCCLCTPLRATQI